MLPGYSAVDCCRFFICITVPFFTRPSLQDMKKRPLGRPARRARKESGQGLVEFALVLPLFLFLVLATVDFGWALRAYIVETNAAREGARYWAINGSPGSCSAVESVVSSRAATLT